MRVCVEVKLIDATHRFSWLSDRIGEVLTGYWGAFMGEMMFYFDLNDFGYGMKFISPEHVSTIL